MTELPRNISYQDVEVAHVNHILEAAGVSVCECRAHLLPDVLRTISDDIQTLQTARRLLIAYARGGTYPRRHTLNDLAHAAGMSVAQVRAAYSPDEIAEIYNILYPPSTDYYSNIGEEEVPW